MKITDLSTRESLAKEDVRVKSIAAHYLYFRERATGRVFRSDQLVTATSFGEPFNFYEGRYKDEPREVVQVFTDTMAEDFEPCGTAGTLKPEPRLLFADGPPEVRDAYARSVFEFLYRPVPVPARTPPPSRLIIPHNSALAPRLIVPGGPRVLPPWAE